MTDFQCLLIVSPLAVVFVALLKRVVEYQEQKERKRCVICHQAYGGDFRRHVELSHPEMVGPQGREAVLAFLASDRQLSDALAELGGLSKGKKK